MGIRFTLLVCAALLAAGCKSSAAGGCNGNDDCEKGATCLRSPPTAPTGTCNFPCVGKDKAFITASSEKECSEKGGSPSATN
jgi:hypothetical protein